VVACLSALERRTAHAAFVSSSTLARTAAHGRSTSLPSVAPTAGCPHTTAGRSEKGASMAIYIPPPRCPLSVFWGGVVLSFFFAACLRTGGEKFFSLREGGGGGGGGGPSPPIAENRETASDFRGP